MCGFSSLASHRAIMDTIFLSELNVLLFLRALALMDLDKKSNPCFHAAIHYIGASENVHFLHTSFCVIYLRTQATIN